MKVLVTGGAGFIGTHLVRRLLREGCSVAVLDNFSPQIHGEADRLPSDLLDHIELFRGDIRNPDLMRKAVSHRDVVVHFAAETGTGQSMYEYVRYQDVNIGGTAALVEALQKDPRRTVRSIVVASSRAIYGEGKYRCLEHGIVYPDARSSFSMREKCFEPLCPLCQAACAPLSTDEATPARPLSFYGLTKYVQEQMVLMFARTQELSAYALRYQNVYGPGQSLNNPYTGILAIFSKLARSCSPIEIFEDGMESRDFVYIDDVIEATWSCIADPRTMIDSFNVGSGTSTTVLHVAKEIVSHFHSDSSISISGAFRQGDIRHNFADLTKINSTFGFVPRTTFHQGLNTFLEWASTQEPGTIRYQISLNELRDRGLLHG